MSESERQHDPTWPYEEIDVRGRIASEPVWECVAGHCTCHPASDKELSRDRIIFSFCDQHAVHIPHARCRVLAQGILLNEDCPHADAAGWITVESRRLPDVVVVEWAPPSTPLEPRYPFRKMYYVRPAAAKPEEAARRRLHNLGYSAMLSLEDNIRAFQRDYGQRETGALQDVKAELIAFHDAGTLPPRPSVVSPFAESTPPAGFAPRDMAPTPKTPDAPKGNPPSQLAGVAAPPGPPTMKIFEVMLASYPDGKPEPPPDGLYVILSRPTDTEDEVSFEHFIVRVAENKTMLIPIRPPEELQLDLTSRDPLWCAWSTDPITLPTPLTPRAFPEVAGFGWPLLARFKGDVLVLPNFRDLTLLSFNLSNASAPAIDKNHPEIQKAVAFYDKLHIRLKLLTGAVPNAMAGAHDIINKSDFTAVAKQPNLGDRKEWGLTNTPFDKTILVYWVNSMNNPIHPAFTATKLQITGAIHSFGTSFTIADAPSIFIENQTHGTAVLAHEIGHAMLFEVGMGRTSIETKLQAKSAVQNFLGKLRIEGADPPSPPGSLRYKRLPAQDHCLPGLQPNAPATERNLMETNGGQTLHDWQVAAIRAATAVGDGP